ncbi:MAG: hypothetical protein ACTHOM_04420 [Allomuricauda sp.]
MKTLKFLCTVMTCMAMVLVSCTGSDGETGPQGKQGIAGADGANGSDGADGADGVSCWDLNGNGVGDADEDINQDGNFDGMDCQGADGFDGQDGADGIDGQDGADGIDGQDGVDGTDGVDGNANVELFFSYQNNFSGALLQYELPYNEFQVTFYSFLVYLEDKNGFIHPVPGVFGGNAHYSKYWVKPSAASTLGIYFYNTSDDSAYPVPLGDFSSLRIFAIQGTIGNKNSTDTMAELKAAGVDTSDYDAVAEYFGLDK